VIVAIVIVCVLVLLVAVMFWADKRDRAKGHVNRGFFELSSTLRANRINSRTLRSRGGKDAAVSPHEFGRRVGRRPGDDKR
jgi:hypothetical protein